MMTAALRTTLREKKNCVDLFSSTIALKLAQA